MILGYNNNYLFLLNQDVFNQLNSETKAVVLLSNQPSLCETNKFIKKALQTCPQLSLGGGVGDLSWSTHSTSDISSILATLVDFDRFLETEEVEGNEPDEDEARHPHQLTVGIKFAGSIQSSTLLISSQVRTEKGVEKRLLEHKTKVKEENCLALMFACCGRGKGLYRGKKDVESRAFRRVFPCIPLIGIFGNGEIGMDTSKPKPQVVKERDFIHGYTTIFFFISYSG
ncbi:F-box only protein 22 [Eurytemora carolleeae]|uniref:F-box only protein 22 n=1 Tax=Eurytemora carolleeae TaxID=1294199 RepID=UPI000C78DACF|nr:F-box only protein 22 [Eurytemora carolleeae]|eukprot:XP_023346409.1 F-box only protein 22-like [Eurytemora affinis]